MISSSSLDTMNAKCFPLGDKPGFLISAGLKKAPTLGAVPAEAIGGRLSGKLASSDSVKARTNRVCNRVSSSTNTGIVPTPVDLLEKSSGGSESRKNKAPFQHHR
jgi:hypothetical protein